MWKWGCQVKDCETYSSCWFNYKAVVTKAAQLNCNNKVYCRCTCKPYWLVPQGGSRTFPTCIEKSLVPIVCLLIDLQYWQIWNKDFDICFLSLRTYNILRDLLLSSAHHERFKGFVRKTTNKWILNISISKMLSDWSSYLNPTCFWYFQAFLLTWTLTLPLKTPSCHWALGRR